MINRRNYTTQVQFDQLISLLGLLTGTPRVTQRQRHHQMPASV